MAGPSVLTDRPALFGHVLGFLETQDLVSAECVCSGWLRAVRSPHVHPSPWAVQLGRTFFLWDDQILQSRTHKRRR
ncbi:hypothetical protein FNF27_05055 [Cafeteria roenbergensis]|uniref:F-box domain-containing protein n=1 Tax=Cafeteria roenbergensis TaxID=33653 RepID=A0A5A8E6J7_CAFRO|nr:hypothetical protein FNF27_05055 [Cafeteria roenbergensis]